MATSRRNVLALRTDYSATRIRGLLTTGCVITFLIPYNCYTFRTENKKMKEVDGVLISFEFTQRLEMPQGAFFAEFKVKDAKLNQPIDDDVFAMPN